MEIQYQNIKFRSKRLAIVEQAIDIINEYQADGYDLTLRQLYYQFVARALIANTDKEYASLGRTINKARLGGYVSWSAIVDRTRTVKRNPHWDGPEHIIESAAEGFGLDTRSTQKHYLEVWVEKDALIGVIERICNELDVSFLSCRGFVSQSAMWRAAMRLIDKESDGKETTIIHLGDHDPSGMDMTRDIQDRLEMFGSSVMVDRVALNMDQVEEYDPPPNPTKLTDSRSKTYIPIYGYDSWELDALDPRVISSIIKKSIMKKTNVKKWKECKVEQEKCRQELVSVSDNWQDIVNYLIEKGLME